MAFLLGSQISSFAVTLQQEAEDADYKGKLESLPGQSGTGCVNMSEDNDYINFTFSIPEEGKYKVFVGVNGAYGRKTFNCVINGSSNSVSGGGATEEVEVGSFKFHLGEASISVTPSWTWVPVDYVRLESDNGESVVFTIAPNPVTPAPTLGATELYNFLAENFGKKTVSGVMLGDMTTASAGVKGHEDVKAVYSVSGKYPALVGVDFMNTTGKSASRGDTWFIDYSNASLKLAKEVWELGGIPAFTWHWRDPEKKTDAFYTPSGNSSENTSFNFMSAFKPGTTEWDVTSSAYKNMVEDIDVLADKFLELQKEGVAGIFRPLHEASGGWFWWGTQGGEAYQQLYRLVYDEMVKVKGVKNLIWVWNPATVDDVDWNPGSEYYDVLSIDIYNNSFDYSSNSAAFNKLTKVCEAGKILALSENGPIPDVDKQADEDAMWSWWMPWYESWTGGFVSKTSSAQWTKVMADERIVTLDEMPGWTPNAAEYFEAENNAAVYPTKISNYFVVNAESAKLVVTDVAGRVVLSKVVKGYTTIPTTEWNSGIYAVTLVSASGNKTYKLVK